MPSLDGAVRKIRSLMQQHGLRRVFVATDAGPAGRRAGAALRVGRRALRPGVPRPFTRPSFAEHESLRRLLPEMVRFEPTWGELELYKDGGVAIVDQWVCAHARCQVPDAP